MRKLEKTVKGLSKTSSDKAGGIIRKTNWLKFKGPIIHLEGAIPPGRYIQDKLAVLQLNRLTINEPPALLISLFDGGTKVFATLPRSTD